MKEKIFFDSNIFIYAADKKSLFHNESVKIIKDCVEKGFFTADICFLEFYQVITDGRKTPRPLSPEETLLYIQKLWNTPEIHVLETDIFDLFEGKSHQDNLVKHNVTRFDIYDYLIAACLKKNHIKEIVTFNSKDFEKYSWITVIDPREYYGSRSSAPTAKRPPPRAARYIPYGRQSISEQDIAAVCKVFRSDWLTQGPKVPEFENAVADYCGANHAVAVNSGTSALHLACLALGVGHGDLVWTSPITFVASANCARYCGSDVDFVDIDPRTYNLSPDRLAEKLKQAKATDRLPKVVIPVHLTGQPCDMEAIHVLSLEYGFRIIEDACHAIGGCYKGEPIGNCRYSDITIFSFHPVKTITTAEGGMAVTNEPEFAQTMTLLRSHGITRENLKFKSQSSKQPSQSNESNQLGQLNHSPPAYYYEQIALGFNYRMTDVQAALGLSQLTRLDEFVARRHALAQRYNELLADLSVTIPWQHPDAYSGMHLYVIRLKPNQIKKFRDQVFEELRSAGIGVNLHYIPVYLQPDFAKMGFKSGHCPEAERYYSEAITLPLFSALSQEFQYRVLEALKEVILV